MSSLFVKTLDAACACVKRRVRELLSVWLPRCSECCYRGAMKKEWRKVYSGALKEERGRGKNFLINTIVRRTGSRMAVVTRPRTGSGGTRRFSTSDVARRKADVIKSRAEGLGAGIEGRYQGKETRGRSSPMTGVARGASVCAESALLLIPRNGSINETTESEQTNPHCLYIEETIGYLPCRRRNQKQEEAQEKEKSGIP